MAEDRLFQRGTTLVRHLRLSPGEAMHWHRDPFHRVSVVLSGDVLAIEYEDGRDDERFAVKAVQMGWDEQTDRVPRAVNVGQRPYEEVTIFFLDHPDAVPQPSADGPS